MKLTLSLLAVCLLLTTACTQQSGDVDTQSTSAVVMDVYFASQTLSGPALVAEPRTIDPEVDTLEQLIATLLSTPQTEGLVSPIPTGVALHSTQLSDAGVLTVDFSERYGSLSGIDLTLADCSIALTLCQLPQVQSVMVTVEGDVIPFRDQQELTPSDVVLAFDLPESLLSE